MKIALESPESPNTFKIESELVGTKKDEIKEINMSDKSSTIDFSIDEPSNAQPEKMMKDALLKELESQKCKVTTSRNKQESENVRYTPIKRKRSLTTLSKRTAMKKARYNLDDVKKSF